MARREFREELGHEPPHGPMVELGWIRQAGGKVVHAWAANGDLDPSSIQSMGFEIEWPPNSGRKQSFPEVDRAEWFDLALARRKILAAQATFIDRLERAAAGGPPP